MVDFRDAPDEVYLENIMHQADGRGPKGGNPKGIRRDQPVPLMKFLVRGPKHNNDVSVEVGTELRPFERIRDDEVRATRRFKFERRRRAWVVNREYFSPRTTNAVPVQNSAERWIIENNSGGWWHPVHIHLEAHQIVKLNGEEPLPQYRHNVDITPLGPNESAEILVKFRTFTGPFVFHCHNLEHEDMRMMHVFDPRPEGHESLNDGTRPHNDENFHDPYGSTYRRVSGMVENEEDWMREGGLFFDANGDVERLEDRDVGFPADNFEPAGQVDPGPPAPGSPDEPDE